MLSPPKPRPPMRLMKLGLSSLVALLAACAGPGGTLPDPSVQYPIAGLPPPPYAVREEHLHRPDPETDPVAARGFTGVSPPGSAPAGPAEEGNTAEEAARSAEQDLLPPPPTFNSLADCERAYGPGQCRTGDEIFSQNLPTGTPLPAPIAQSYMPYAYGSMTGALSHGYFAPPGVYVPGIPYRQYVSPLVISRYQVITPVVIQRYRAVPLPVREAQIRRGPIIHPHDRRPYSLGTRPAYPRPAAAPRTAATPVAPPPLAPQATPNPTPSGAPTAARSRWWTGPQGSARAPEPMRPPGAMGASRPARPPGGIGPPGPTDDRSIPTPLTGTIRPAGPPQREARPSSPPPRIAAPAGPARPGAQSTPSSTQDRRPPPRDPKRRDDSQPR